MILWLNATGYSGSLDLKLCILWALVAGSAQTFFAYRLWIVYSHVSISITLGPRSPPSAV
ncbi:hypothetical protein CVT25_004069 [Psilocybe cyanescens]|uniref:Uncharacterized protein n=1 Tax=Psilocybe cyanescens TaxID=93625 RepID=A0A409XQ27_PSICY|nr:hypothetical protein CVT25_004069 [Psilocybe cyanescens]